MPGQSFSMELAQKQTLRLNAQLIQSLEMMALPLEALQEKIAEEVAVNPTLRAEEPGGGAMSYEEYSEKVRKGESRVEDYGDSAAYGSDLSDSHQAWLEGAVAAPETLQDHLLWQLGCVQCADEVREAAGAIVSNLDSEGFHSSPPSEILPEELRPYEEEALSVLHRLDPPGIAVSDYRESLVVQAEALGVSGEELEIFKKMVQGELGALKAGKIGEVAKRLKADPEDISALWDFLKTLTPHPASAFSSGNERHITPDLSIKVEEGKIAVRLNDSSLPALSIDPEYEAMSKELAANRKKTKEEKEASSWLKEKMRSSESLIRQVEMRNSTLLKVGAVLAEKQKGFFLFGPGSLKPLTLKDVAEEVGVHEATVSRITTSKYVDTDWGVMPLKSLFSSAVKTTTGSADLSKEAVKQMVRQIIEENGTGKPLSDQKISDILRDKGVSCARRTVAKYRGELGLDSSFER